MGYLLRDINVVKEKSLKRENCFHKYFGKCTEKYQR